LLAKGKEMKKAILAVFLVLFFTSISLANEILPERSKGISMHMLPMRVANLDTKLKWGFMVSHTEYLKPETGKQILQTTNEFLTYVRKQDEKVQENGVWIVITNPAAYSKEELTLLEDIKALCRKEKIALFVARGSQLPNGWVRY
jgi:hypothetical protein